MRCRRKSGGFIWPSPISGKPATAREIADRARLDTSKCSAQLARLTEKGAVEVTGGSPRRKLYYLTERLYNIYYLMRRARGPHR